MTDMNKWKIVEANDEDQYIFAYDGMYIIAWLNDDGTFDVNFDNVFRSTFGFYKWVDCPFREATSEDVAKASALSQFVNEKCSKNMPYIKARAR